MITAQAVEDRSSHMIVVQLEPKQTRATEYQFIANSALPGFVKKTLSTMQDNLGLNSKGAALQKFQEVFG